ncbi:glycoside hydrolase family 26 protein [Kocuria sabuli]|uniref:glycoside hydrolase family 26 protein n=1 Tax=Kocuria sabuli TaxID=3071448 RepID=UPI0034D3BEFA
MPRTTLLSAAAVASAVSLIFAPAVEAAPKGTETKTAVQTKKSTTVTDPVPDASAESPVAPSADLAGTTTTPTSSVMVAAAAAAEPQVRTCPLRFGVGTPGGPGASQELAEVASLTGEKPSIVLSYKDFEQPVPYWELEQARSAGATTLLTWEPWAWGGGTDQPAYALDRIAAGDHDAHITDWATRLADWGGPVMLRFGHEMNGNWYPWAEGVNGNGAGDYVAAYRHVHDIFTAAGADNVQWVWNPNVPYWGSTPLDGLYPGADYVDVAGLDGYNWGTSQSWSTWQQPWELFGWGLAEMRRLAPGKEIVVAETASAESGGSKAEWNAHLVYYLAAQPDVTGLVWFHHDKETDWRINSSASSASALANELAKRPCP